MKKSTTNYDQFKLLKINREKGVSENHVKELMESIRMCNMLELDPICVDGDYNVLDGQHRLTAAKRLGVPIWYEVKENATIMDMAIMNVRKNWTLRDYLHLYASQGKESYVKLRNFMEKHNLPVTIAVNIACGVSHVNQKQFRLGRFVFNDSRMHANIGIRKQSVQIIRDQIGAHSFLGSAKLWKAIGVIVDHPDFDENKWITNLMILANRVCMRATTKDYLEAFLKIYNFRNQKKIVFKEEDVLE